MTPQRPDDEITIGEVHRVCLSINAQLTKLDARGQEHEARIRVLEDRSNRGAVHGGIWGAIGGIIGGFMSGLLGGKAS